MSVPKLSFREPPIRLKIRKPTPKIFPKPLAKIPEPDIESQEIPPQATSNNIFYFIAFVILLVTMRIITSSLFTSDKHTIKQLKCRLKNRIISCYGVDPVGTFVIEIPTSCSGSIYEVGGHPFSVAECDKFFKVPAKDLTVRDVNGKCEPRAYLDSKPMQLNYPFTWITTNQHTTFTLLDGNEIIVDKVSADLFTSVKRGPWIAYTYDIPGTTAKVIGDGSDIIHVYNGVSS